MRDRYPAEIIPIPLNGDSYIAIVQLNNMQSICVLVSGRELSRYKNIDEERRLIGAKIEELKRTLEGITWDGI